MLFDDLQHRFKTDRSLLLVRSRSAPFILSFLHQVFTEARVTTLTNMEMRSKLEGYFEEHSRDDWEEETGEQGAADLSLKASLYIEKWSTQGFIRKYPGEDGEDLHELTAETNKVFNWLTDLDRPEFIGANSRFRDIFSGLKEMVEQSNADPEERIRELEKKKYALEEEINLIRLGKRPQVYSDTDLRERFYNINRAARELLGDFYEVEQNFQTIRKELQRKYSESESVKGSLLIYALDALDEIYAKDQGKSFKAFWEFLMDEKRHLEFNELMGKLLALLDERGIEHQNDRFLKNLKRLLHVSGKKVIDANYQLSEKISRVLSEKNQLMRKRAMELISGIRQHAYALTESNIRDEAFIQIEDEPELQLIDRYRLTEENQLPGVPMFPTGQGGSLDGNIDINSLFDQFAIDRKKLQDRIDDLLNDKEQVSLKEVIDKHGLDNDLAEVVGYFSIACEDSNHHIFRDTVDPIMVKGRKVNVPLILFVKPVIA